MNRFHLAPGIDFTKLQRFPPLADAISAFELYPERSGKLVRVHDNRQLLIACSETTPDIAPSVLSGLGFSRRYYWWKPDLEDFLVSARLLEPNSLWSWLEFSWRGYDIAGYWWRRFTVRYRLLVDQNGVAYHLGETLDVKSISEPRKL